MSGSYSSHHAMSRRLASGSRLRIKSGFLRYSLNSGALDITSAISVSLTRGHSRLNSSYKRASSRNLSASHARLFPDLGPRLRLPNSSSANSSASKQRSDSSVGFNPKNSAARRNEVGSQYNVPPIYSSLGRP